MAGSLGYPHSSECCQQMGDEWSIKSLSQTIEDDEEEDLVPTTPSQEDMDMTAPSQDSTSLLADTHGPGECLLPHFTSPSLPHSCIPSLYSLSPFHLFTSPLPSSTARVTLHPQAGGRCLRHSLLGCLKTLKVSPSHSCPWNGSHSSQ